MAADYTRTIVFKVEDQAIKRATNQIATSLKKIEKTLERIEKKGFKNIANSANIAAKGIDKTTKSLSKLEKVQNAVKRGAATVGVTGAVGFGLSAAVIGKSIQKYNQFVNIATQGNKRIADAMHLHEIKATGLKVAYGALKTAITAHPLATGVIAAAVFALGIDFKKTTTAAMWFGNTIKKIAPPLGSFLNKINPISAGLHNLSRAARRAGLDLGMVLNAKDLNLRASPQFRKGGADIPAAFRTVDVQDQSAFSEVDSKYRHWMTAQNRGRDRGQLLGMKGRVYQNVAASRHARSGGGFADWEANQRGIKNATARELIIKSIERKNRQLVKQGKEILQTERMVNQEMKKRLGMQGQIDKMFTDKARRERRMGARLRMAGKKMGMERLDSKGAESLMLGAGFPMLFGGGIGAVGGGLGGSVLGNMMGLGGFGTQIIGSAIGTQLETLVMKADKLGKTLRDLDMEQLEESGIKLNRELAVQIDHLEKIGDLAEARRLVEIEVLKNTGAMPGTHQKISATVKQLGDSWNRVSTTIGTALGILASPFLDILAKILDMVNFIFAAVNAVLSTFAALDRLLSDMLGITEKIATAEWERSRAGKEALAAARERLRISEREWRFSRDLALIENQRPFGSGFASQRKNAALTRQSAIAKALQEQEKRKELVTKSKKQGGMGIRPGTEQFTTAMDAIGTDTSIKINAAEDSFNKDIRRIDIAYNKKIKAEGKLLEQANLQNEIQVKINEAKQIGDQDLARRLEAESQILAIQYDLHDKLQEELTDQEIILEVERARAAIKGVQIGLAGQLTEQERRSLALQQAIESTIKNGIVDGIEAAIDGTKTLGEVASQVINQIARQLITTGVDQFFAGFNQQGGDQGAGGGKNRGFLSAIGNILGGGIFGAIGGLFKADGGPVTGGSPYVVGEKGPELFVPGSSGNIIPNHAMGGGGMVINVDASGSSVEGDAEKSRELGLLIGAAVQAEIGNQQRPGGMLY